MYLNCLHPSYHLAGPPPQKCVKLQYSPEGYNLLLVMVILGFLTIPWLGPKDTEPRMPSVPKVKLGRMDRVCHQSQRRS